jgi:hypothetical protein
MDEVVDLCFPSSAIVVPAASANVANSFVASAGSPSTSAHPLGPAPRAEIDGRGSNTEQADDVPL